MPIDLEIVSPDRVLLKRPVDMVVMPAWDGDLAAMPLHAPMMVALRGGVITLHEGGQATDRFFVAGGFAEITPDRCTILADEAVPVAEVDHAAAERRVVDAQAAYQAAGQDNEARELALDRLQAAQAMAGVAGG
ncbi:MAG: ATP synthase F1 subunit epsilon [Janthinobacterium lividum]